MNFCLYLNCSIHRVVVLNDEGCEVKAVVHGNNVSGQPHVPDKAHLAVEQADEAMLVVVLLLEG